MFDGTEYWCKISMKTDLCCLKWHEEIWQIFVHRLKNSNLILESKTVELNQNKIENNQIDQMQYENFILLWR